MHNNLYNNVILLYTTSWRHPSFSAYSLSDGVLHGCWFFRWWGSCKVRWHPIGGGKAGVYCHKHKALWTNVVLTVVQWVCSEAVRLTGWLLAMNGYVHMRMSVCVNILCSIPSGRWSEVWLFIGCVSLGISIIHLGTNYTLGLAKKVNKNISYISIGD